MNTRRKFITALAAGAGLPLGRSTTVISPTGKWLVQATPSTYWEGPIRPLFDWRFKPKCVVSPASGKGPSVSIAMSCEAWCDQQWYGTHTSATITLTGTIKSQSTGELNAWVSPSGTQSTRFTRTFYEIGWQDTETATVIVSVGLMKGFHSAIANGYVQLYLTKIRTPRISLSGIRSVLPGYPQSLVVPFSARVDSIQEVI